MWRREEGGAGKWPLTKPLITSPAHLPPVAIFTLMGLSRSTRITLLLVIDVLFFFIELIVGPFFLLTSPLCHLNCAQDMPWGLSPSSLTVSICSSTTLFFSAISFTDVSVAMY